MAQRTEFVRPLEFLSRHYLDKTLALRNYSLRITKKTAGVKAAPSNIRVAVHGGVKTKISRLMVQGRTTGVPVTVSDLLQLIADNFVQSKWKSDWDKLVLFDNKKREIVSGNTHLTSLNGYCDLATPYNKNDKQEVIDCIDALDAYDFTQLLDNVELDLQLQNGNQPSSENMMKALFSSFVKQQGLTSKADKERLVAALIQETA